MRNAELGYGFRVTDTQDGISFYQGNSIFGEKYYFEHVHLQELHGMEWKELYGITAENNDSAYFYAKAFEYIRENPGTAFKLLLVKIAHQVPVDAEGDRSGLLAHHHRHAVGLLAHPDPRPVTQTDRAVFQLLLADRKHAARTGHPVLRDHHAAVVQRRLGMKNRHRQLA